MKSSRIAVAVISIGFIAFSVGGSYAQTSDFFSNTQSTDQRAGSGGAISGGGSIATNNPGFNPCSGGDGTNGASRDAAGACVTAGTGSIDATSLLSPDNLGTIFQQAGPGAITDNMFGKVTAVLLTPATFTDCGATAANISTVALADVLNCGNVRITPGTQGMNIPTFPATNSLGSLLTGNANLNGDFCAGPDATPGTDCVDTTQIIAAHTGLNLINSFEWNPGGATATCGASGVGLSDQPRFCSDQIMEQVTALNTSGIGTLTAPGANDQVVRIETTFEVVTSNTLATMPAPFTVNIAISISDPDQTGGTGTGFTQSIGTVGSGSTFGTSGMTFSHNQLEGVVDLDGDAVVNETQEFSCGVAALGNFVVGCSQYPTGPTQTTGNIANAELP